MTDTTTAARPAPLWMRQKWALESGAFYAEADAIRFDVGHACENDWDQVGDGRIEVRRGLCGLSKWQYRIDGRNQCAATFRTRDAAIAAARAALARTTGVAS